MQMKCQNIAEHARLLAPSLALNFGMPPARADTEMDVNDSVILIGKQLKPLFKLFVRLLCQVEGKVHLQQAYGMSKISYNNYYDHVFEEKSGLTDFSGSWAERHDVEKDFLKKK